MLNYIYEGQLKGDYIVQKFIELIISKRKTLLYFIIIVVLLILSYIIYINKNNSVFAINKTTTDIIKKASKIKVVKKKIKVDVKGMVNNPGVYELDENSRVIDAINVAGGVNDLADTSSINLSKKLKDENVIVVESTKEPEKVIEYVYKECNCPKFNDACLKTNEVVNYQEVKEDNNKENSEIIEAGLISINSATKEELQTLSGVGESKAIAIIKYREENGNFKSIEEVMNVSGIGNSLFEKIKDNITL